MTVLTSRSKVVREVGTLLGVDVTFGGVASVVREAGRNAVVGHEVIAVLFFKFSVVSAVNVNKLGIDVKPGEVTNVVRLVGTNNALVLAGLKREIILVLFDKSRVVKLDVDKSPKLAGVIFGGVTNPVRVAVKLGNAVISVLYLKSRVLKVAGQVVGSTEDGKLGGVCKYTMLVKLGNVFILVLNPSFKDVTADFRLARSTKPGGVAKSVTVAGTSDIDVRKVL